MKLFYTALLIGLVTSPALAKEKEPPARAQAFQRLVDCRAIKDSAARLACYDNEVATLDAAEKSKELVIVDKEQVRQAKRTLFGLSLPSIKLFGGDDDDDAVAQIESKIASASEDINGWTIRLVDGSVWRQIDSKPFYRLPKAGLEVVVKRAALGSYMLRVGGSPGVRVKRVI
ncbi:hypothetical protein [Sphingomonas sp.]|uniref:hypothetical protein n=1 Tax=Sphingomonas sp. TaxID=28214 RepID=UPI003D6C7A1F